MRYYYLKRHKGIFYYLQNSKRKYGYRLYYYDDNHKRHFTSHRGFTNMHKAINALTAVQKRVRDLQQSHDITFRMACVRFIHYKKELGTWKITTLKSYTHLLNNYIIPEIGNVKLVDLTPSIYRRRCIGPLFSGHNPQHHKFSHKTIMNINSRVQTVLNFAVGDELINKNPLKSVKLPQSNVNPKRSIMNEREQHTFNKCLSRHSELVQIIFHTLEYTGMRKGELLGLKWNDVDIKHRTISIRHTRDAYGLRKPKTSSSRRKIAISHTLNKELLQYMTDCKKRYNINKDSFVILGKRGKPLVPNEISIQLKHLLIESGLKKLVGHFVTHSFRHMFASNLISHGIDPIMVSKMLGHANPDITMKIYAQSAPGQTPDISKAFKKMGRK